MERKWYIIHTLTGQEDNVKKTIEKRLDENPLKELIPTVLIPTEKISEVKAGKKKISSRKFYPGYVLVEMVLNEDTWYFLKNIPGVSGGRLPSIAKGFLTSITTFTIRLRESIRPSVLVAVPVQTWSLPAKLAMTSALIFQSESAWAEPT